MTEHGFTLTGTASDSSGMIESFEVEESIQRLGSKEFVKTVGSETRPNPKAVAIAPFATLPAAPTVAPSIIASLSIFFDIQTQPGVLRQQPPGHRKQKKKQLPHRQSKKIRIIRKLQDIETVGPLQAGGNQTEKSAGVVAAGFPNHIDE